MRNAGGYSIITGPQPVVEQDTFTCGHCCKVTFLPPKCQPEHRCKVCYSYICEGCASKDCLPLEEQLRMMESPAYKPRRIFKIGNTSA